MSNLLLGFDPGGEDSFGWCVGELTGGVNTILIRNTGIEDNCSSALNAAKAEITGSDKVVGAGIDAPLYWVPNGGRQVDQVIRDRIKARGCNTQGGTVQHFNSLAGACVAQGMMLGFAIRKEFPDAMITEAHPKAMLWLLNPIQPQGILLAALGGLFTGAIMAGTEDQRDAALATLSAKACVQNQAGWINMIDPLEPGATSLLFPGPLSYFLPA